MFTVTDSYTFTHPVKVSVPSDGGHEKQEFRATFKAIPVDEQDAFDLGTTEGATSFLKSIVVGLSDLVDDAGEPVPYSDRIRDQLLRHQFVRMPMINAYFSAIGKAIEGN